MKNSKLLNKLQSQNKDNCLFHTNFQKTLSQNNMENKMNDVWEVFWSISIGKIDFETFANIQASSATDAVCKFIQLYNTIGDNIDWEKQVFRAEKNHTYFLFIHENGKLRRI